MRFTTVFVTLAAAGSALAGSWERYRYKSARYGDCIPMHKVDELVENYVTIVSNISSITDDEANDIISETFVDWSNSISAFFGAPYSAPAFSSRDDFVTKQRAANQRPIEIEDVPGYTCDKIMIIWNAPFTSPVETVSRGISLVTIVKEDGKFKIARIDVEFNSLAWALGMGGGYTVFQQSEGNFQCPATTSKLL